MSVTIAPTPWLQRTPSSAAAARIFCIPHAGCGAGIFGSWPSHLDGVEFLPVELPGRLTRFGEAMPGTIGELAGMMISGLAQYLDVPYAFFGHCWSALIAYETTVQLERSTLPGPARLFVSSQLAPQDGPLSRMLDMDDEELMAELAVMIGDQGHEPHPELLAFYVKILRADVESGRRYVVPHPVRAACPVSAIGWSQDEEVDPGQIGGWADCGDTEFRVFPGRHHRFMDAPRELLEYLAATVHRAR
jgi:surfactin synthase thioesterase subunit